VARTVSVILQAEIGQYVSGMTKAAIATKGVGESADMTSKKASKGFDLAGRGAQLFGLAAAGALVGVVAKSMDFEKAMSAVQAATGATASSMGDLRAAALKAGADTQYSATEAANAITEMATAGVSAKDIMGGGLTGVLNLAAAGQLEVADAAGIASTAMTQFSLSGAQLPHVADLLAAGAGKAMGSVDDLGQALNQAGLLASSTGVSIEETTGTLAAFASAGLIGSDAGTSFKTMLQQLQNPSEKSAELMQQLGINAYDAQGKFVGLADLAQQLKSHLGGLTQAQRDQALAQIFGTDAARAATVLYREGAAGINEWTNKVNDAGYAQKQAAALTDNLSGDLERLGGSFDTLLISIGQGLQGPLRGLTQMLGGLVDGVGGAINVFADMPGPVQVAIGAMAAWAIGGGKVLGVVGDLRTKFQGFREEQELQRALFAMQQREAATTAGSYSQIGSALERTGGQIETAGYKAATAKAALGGLAKAIGPELAVAAATYAIASVADSISRIANAGDDAKNEIKDLNRSLKEMGNAERIDATASAVTHLRDELADTKQAADEAKSSLALAAFNPLDLGSSIADYKDATAAADEYRKAIAELEVKQAAASDTADMLTGSMGMTRSEILALADAAGIDLSQGYDAVYGKMLLFRDAQDAANGSTQAASSTMSVFSDEMDQVKASADDAKNQIDMFKMSLDILTGAHVSLVQAEGAVYDALRNATDATKGLTGEIITQEGHLNNQTEAGYAVQQALVDVADSANQYIATMIQQGATAEDANAKDAELRQSFYNTALQMTGSAQAAQELTDQIYGIPDQRTTKINADTQAAQNAINNTQALIDNLHGKTVTITMTATGTVAAILGDPSARSGRTGPAGYAAGGYTGPGGKYQPAGIVHAGEVVFSQDDVAAHGGVGMVELFRKSRPRGYADGGPVIQINTDDSQVAASVAAARSAVTKMMSAGPVGGAGVQRWSALVLQALAMMGQPASLLNTVLRRMNQESGGNPRAINLWDSNAKRGTPSKGLMQTIDPTFRAYHFPGTSNDVYDPLANILASMKYAVARYGSLAAAYNKMGGYETGTEFVPETGPAVLHKGEAVLTREQGEAYRAGLRSREVSGGWSGGGGGSVSVAPPVVKVFLDGEEWRGMARVEALGVVVDYADDVDRRANY
jgi:TP901 family phage tail tape measure protein